MDERRRRSVALVEPFVVSQVVASVAKICPVHFEQITRAVRRGGAVFIHQIERLLEKFGESGPVDHYRCLVRIQGAIETPYAIPQHVAVEEDVPYWGVSPILSGEVVYSTLPGS